MHSRQYRWQHNKGRHPLIKQGSTVQINRSTSIKVHIMAMKAVFAQKLGVPQKGLSDQLSELLQSLWNKAALKSTIG